MAGLGGGRRGEEMMGDGRDTTLLSTRKMVASCQAIVPQGASPFLSFTFPFLSCRPC